MSGRETLAVVAYAVAFAALAFLLLCIAWPDAWWLA